MEHIGAYEAKTHLPKLLANVLNGKQMIITKHGNPVAILSPFADKKKYASDTTIMKLKEFRKNKRLNGLNLKSMIQEGRD
ncbi:MAG: type II toxin-antitoxin system prevent-host-death family antitoxin [Deltaproteobacteria bacterium]|nr:type II toxin-antitoxin system prevent-host-death family antitoxin [Deltaproteobacteria bacterium]